MYSVLQRLIYKSGANSIKVRQLSSNFRNEERPAFGLCRTLSFIMQDCYMIGNDEEETKREYFKAIERYVQVFKDLGLETYQLHTKDGSQMSCEILVSTVGSNMKTVEYFVKDSVVSEKHLDDSKKLPMVEVAHVFYFDKFFGNFFSISFGFLHFASFS